MTRLRSAASPPPPKAVPLQAPSPFAKIKAMKDQKSQYHGSPASIDEYLSGVPEPARTTLSKIRAAIRSAVPADAAETISYGMPAFKHSGVLVWFAAFADHCSFFPTSSIVEQFQDELKGYKTSKGTIQFPKDRPLPATLVRKMVKARLAQTATPGRTRITLRSSRAGGKRVLK